MSGHGRLLPGLLQINFLSPRADAEPCNLCARGIARPFCSSVSYKPQELPLPSVCVGRGRGRQGLSLRGWGSPKSALVRKNPGGGVNQQRGNCWGEQVDAPGRLEELSAVMCMLCVGCCCTSLAGTLSPVVSASPRGQRDAALGRTERLVPAGSSSQSISYSSRGN